MWAVIKIDHRKLNLLKSDFKEKLGPDFQIYSPKTAIKKKYKNKFIFKEINMMGDYIFCFHKKFSQTEIIKKLQFCRGLKYFLNGFCKSQFDIENFVTRCKKSENSLGYISHNFFTLNLTKKYKFSNGPFASNIFKILELQRNKLEILIGSLKTTIKKNEFLFSPV